MAKTTSLTQNARQVVRRDVSGTSLYHRIRDNIQKKYGRRR